MNTKYSGRNLGKELEEINSFMKLNCSSIKKSIQTLGVSFGTEDFEYFEDYWSLCNLIILLSQTGAEYIFLHDTKGRLKINLCEISQALEKTIYANDIEVTINQVTANKIVLESTSFSGHSILKPTIVFCSKVDGTQGIEHLLEIQRTNSEIKTVPLRSEEDEVTVDMYKAMEVSISRELIETKLKNIDLLLVIGSSGTNHDSLPRLNAFTEVMWIPSLSSANSTQIISCLQKYFAGDSQKCYGKSFIKLPTLQKFLVTFNTEGYLIPVSSCVKRPFDQTDKEAFEKLFPSLVKDVTQSPEYSDMPSTNEWLEKVINYNVPFGKKNRGIAVAETYRYLMNDSLSDEQVRLSFILGWCLEVLQASFLVADDIMDGSEYRRGKLSWYRNEEIGSAAFNDSWFLESIVYFLLEKHFKHLPCFPQLLIEFHNVTHKTLYGQSLDTLTAVNRNLKTYTMALYDSIAKYKTAYYTFYAPVKIAMVLAGVEDSSKGQMTNILLKMGHYFQVQDDFLDCFGDPKVTGKVGTDILDTKCTWLFVKAMEVASLEQRDNLLNVYGSDSDHKVETITQIYRNLKIPELYKSYEEATYKSLVKSISSLSQDIPNMKPILTSILSKICKRQA